MSSTLGELAAERQAVSRAVTALHLTPVLFELGARPQAPQEVYRAYLAQSDVFVGLYWQRYGQTAAGLAVSGLEDEFELSQQMPRLLYVKTPAPQREPRLEQLLDRIREQASYRRFGTPAELGRLVRDDLATLLSERFTAAMPLSAGPFAAGRGQSARARTRQPRPLPAESTSLVGRERAVGDLTAMLQQPRVRLVTLTGPGGIGKTRLAIAAGQRLAGRLGSRTAFVSLAPVTDPGLVLAEVGRAAGIDLAGSGVPLEALAEHLGDDSWLLVLDNMEQVAAAAGQVGELLARCPGLTIMVTSRSALGLRAEREYPVPPLTLPAEEAAPVEVVASSPAVALFVDRATAVRPGFSLTEDNATAVAEICRRLDGLPLAIELAAARTRLLDPAALLLRLSRSLDALGTGMADMPERQRTLRATVRWSMEMLTAPERSLLEVAAVFVDGWTIEAAAQVAGLAEDEALRLSEELARHSLLYLDSTRLGSRCRMLETVRAYAGEQLLARPDAAQIQRRHARYFRVLAEQADRPLRGAGQTAWLERLEADGGNLAAAVRWYLAHDRAPLPHFIVVLWSFWFLRDHADEARPWIEQLMQSASSLDQRARAEAVWASALTALQVGDDATAVSASQRLGPLLNGLDDPYLHAVSRLIMAWSTPITGDFAGVLRDAAASLAQLRALDEPFWTALALGSLGWAETVLGNFDDATRHVLEARDLGDLFDSAWLAAWSRIELGALAVVQGRLAEAQQILDDALSRSLTARSTSSVTLCLAIFARLAFAAGDAQQAALLAGAVDGLRRRGGERAWPMLRQGEAELAADVRQVLGAPRFDETFGTGSRLSQREAAAAARKLAVAPP